MLFYKIYQGSPIHTNITSFNVLLLDHHVYQDTSMAQKHRLANTNYLSYRI